MNDDDQTRQPVVTDLYESLRWAYPSYVHYNGGQYSQASQAEVTRYNGGWIKRVEGLDKTKANGYSILGDFARDGMAPHEPGLYLDCSIGGSRKNQHKHYHLFSLHGDGRVQVHAHLGNGRSDWAVRLWQPIEEVLEAKAAEPETPRENGHDYVATDDGSMRCGKCDCRMGGRVARNPCGFHECSRASRIDACEEPAVIRLAVGNDKWRSYTYHCHGHLLEELGHQLKRRLSIQLDHLATPGGKVVVT